MYKLSCLNSNPRHTHFIVFDSAGANCGALVVLTSDLVNFLTRNWRGNIDWNGRCPINELDRQKGTV